MQWLPDYVYIEDGTFNKVVHRSLMNMGYHLMVGSPLITPELGAVEAIEQDQVSNHLIGVTDYRRPGGAVAE
jgi:hypothetical protein